MRARATATRTPSPRAPPSPRPRRRPAAALQANPAAALNIAPPVGMTSAWADAFSQKVLFLTNAHDQTAQLSLNPPDLGPLQVVLNVADKNATAMFMSAHQQVRDAVEAALPQLREALQQSGIGLGSNDRLGRLGAAAVRLVRPGRRQPAAPGRRERRRRPRGTVRRRPSRRPSRASRPARSTHSPDPLARRVGTTRAALRSSPAPNPP
ncbi:MAG: flagellar hook-length control protein FliK [Pararobbsia sp.]